MVVSWWCRGSVTPLVSRTSIDILSVFLSFLTPELEVFEVFSSDWFIQLILYL